MPERWTPAYARLFDPEHELRGEPVCRAFAWLDLCNLAQWKKGTRVVNGSPVTIDRGEVLASVRFLAERWRWSKGKVERFLSLLRDREKIETANETPAGTTYRIVTYDTYANALDPDRDSNEDTGGTRTGTRTGTPPKGTKDVAGYSDSVNETGTNGTPNGTRTGTNSSNSNKEIQRDLSRAKRLPVDWAPSEDHLLIAREEGRDLQREVVKFRDWASGGGKTRKDWNATFRNWLRSDIGRNGKSANGASSGALARPRL